MDAKEKFEQIAKSIGVVVQTTRKTFGNKSQECLSAVLRSGFGMAHETKAWLAEVEQGVREISFDDFRNICAALKTSAEEILDCALRAEEGHFLGNE
jgi:DNA-binding Xre family transcriptional regulator